MNYTNNQTAFGVRLGAGCVGDSNPSSIDLILDIRGNGQTYGTGDDAIRIMNELPGASNIQITGQANCGKKQGSYHQDGVQAHRWHEHHLRRLHDRQLRRRHRHLPGRRRHDLLLRLPTQHERGSRQVHRLQPRPARRRGAASGSVVGAHFRTGRFDMATGLCEDGNSGQPYSASPPCLTSNPTGDAERPDLPALEPPRPVGQRSNAREETRPAPSLGGAGRLGPRRRSATVASRRARAPWGTGRTSGLQPMAMWRTNALHPARPGHHPTMESLDIVRPRTAFAEPCVGSSANGGDCLARRSSSPLLGVSDASSGGPGRRRRRPTSSAERAGPDQLSGLGGDDRLYGQRGADRLAGGRGNDRPRRRPGTRCAERRARQTTASTHATDRSTPSPAAPGGTRSGRIRSTSARPTALHACTIDITSGCVPRTTLSFTDETWTCSRPLARYGKLPIKVIATFTNNLTRFGVRLDRRLYAETGIRAPST